ncbi:hypothetical protein DFH09DRAFT_1098880 [Mycena vulgaris]|nr:hypothetical protein DFH09DRAFT_1098880 [Mycena vulgaris]
MSTNSSPHSTISWLMPAKRTYLACLNCRRRKIKLTKTRLARAAPQEILCPVCPSNSKGAKFTSALDTDSEAVHAPAPSKIHIIDEGERTKYRSLAARHRYTTETVLHDNHSFLASSSTSICHKTRPAPHPQFSAGSSDTYQYGGILLAATTKGGVGDLTTPMALRVRARDSQASNLPPRTSPLRNKVDRARLKYYVIVVGRNHDSNNEAQGYL